MNIIIPMMGNGKRFKDAGYSQSKPLIRAYGKEILMWLLDSIDCKRNNVVIACRSDIEVERLSERIKSKYHDSVRILTLSEDTLGAAHTVRIALESGIFDLNDPIAVCDSDTFYKNDHSENIQGVGNCVFYFEDTGSSPIYSYLQTIDDKVIRIVEKEKISNQASVGTYCFERGEIALEHICKIMSAEKKSKGEYYLSTVYQSMIDSGILVKAKKASHHTCLGTPSQIQGFSPEKKLRICFDIDNTLVSEPRIPADYSSVEPISKNIEFLRYLKSEGHTIILQTARRMKTHSGNVGKLVADIGRVTFQTLDKFDIPFDEIYFGKPYADFYIDDKAIDAYGDLEKLTGVYLNEMITREHNQIIEGKSTIVKTSTKESIRGELYWYLNAPECVRHMIPKLINYNDNQESISIEIEKINGPTFSKLLTSDALRDYHLNTLIDSINQIHGTKIENTEVDISKNYLEKLKKRYFSIGIPKNEKLEKIYQKTFELIEKYESSNKMTRSNIHGDPVFTNVLLDQNNRIKLIDMRGMVGESLTITGDRNYDYAKIYQSLSGYDFLIRNQNIEDSKLKKLRDQFVSRVDIDESYLKIISSFLIFTCIPLQPEKIRNNLLDLTEKIQDEI